MIIVDFETRSRCNLLTAGSYLYATDPSTTWLCMGWTDRDTGEEGLLWPGDTLPPQLEEAIAQGRQIAAHNAEFDMQIWEQCTPFTPVPLEQWYCTAAQARVNALPGSLADATRCLFGKSSKSHAGAKLIQQLSIPRADGTFNEDPTLMKKMGL